MNLRATQSRRAARDDASESVTPRNGTTAYQPCRVSSRRPRVVAAIPPSNPSALPARRLPASRAMRSGPASTSARNGSNVPAGETEDPSSACSKIRAQLRTSRAAPPVALLACAALGRISVTRSKPPIAPSFTHSQVPGAIAPRGPARPPDSAPMTTSRYRTSGAPSASRKFAVACCCNSCGQRIHAGRRRRRTRAGCHEKSATTTPSMATIPQRTASPATAEPVRPSRCTVGGTRITRCGNPERQHPIRHRARHEDAHQRSTCPVAPGPGKSANSSASDPQAVVRIAMRNVGASAPTRRRDRFVGAQLRQQETRIVDRLAQQRRAEAERNALHGAESQADGDDAREQSRGGWNESTTRRLATDR